MARILTGTGWKTIEEKIIDEGTHGYANKLIGDDEDEKRAAFHEKATKEMHAMLARHAKEAYEIGGGFRGPGIWSQLHKAHKQALEHRNTKGPAG